MKYEGSVAIIEDIDRFLRFGAKAALQSDGSSGVHSILGDDSKSRLFCRRYLVSNQDVLVTVYLEFDYRDATGHIEVRDDKAWHIAAQYPIFAKHMSRLQPFYKKHKGIMKALDRLLEEEGEEKWLHLEQSPAKGFSELTAPGLLLKSEPSSLTDKVTQQE